jgi:hypothetical protein
LPGRWTDPNGRGSAVQLVIVEQECGCEDLVPEHPCLDRLEQCSAISFCGKHDVQAELLGKPVERLYLCGECGFHSRQWERLERHVYREHLGADRP